jgi:hypothetical protein
VIRHVTLLEAAEDLSAPETTPIGAVPAAEPVAHPSAPAQPPQNTARRALYAAATVILVIGVLLLGVVLKDALRPNGTTAAPSNKPAQTVDTGTTTGGDTSTSARPPSTSAQDGNIGPSAPEGEADRTNDGGTSDGATNQNSDGGPSKGGTNQLNGGGVSESVTASATPSTQSRSPGEWTLTIRLAPDSDGDIQVAHNGGEQETCSKSLNGPAVECDYSIPDNNTVTLIPVDFVESWGSGLCEGADRRGGCPFFGNTSDTEFNLFVMRDPG